MSPNDQLSNLRRLLKIEKEEDFQQYQQKILNTSVKDRKKEGVCWYPARLQSHRIGMGDRVVAQIEKPIEDETSHVFQVGSVVSVFRNTGNQERADYCSGVVSYLRKNVMKVVLNTYDLPEWIYDSKIGVDLMFDEATYREMDKALDRMIKVSEGRLAELKDIFYGAAEATVSSGHDYRSIKLNPTQNVALNTIFNAHDLAIIHGPPGTGKTTTIVQAIKETVKLEKQVLVSAPSNAAVDLLVEKLTEEGVKVLRLGHPARVTGAAQEQSLDFQVSQHLQYKQLKEVRRRSEELKQIGLKYKRNFGHAERKQRRLILDEARSLKLEADHIEHYITTDLLNNCSVVACTLINANHQLISSRNFKSVFIDEASQALEAACWIPIMKAERVILAGDHHQLPPTIKSVEAAKKGLEVTLFEKGIKHQQVDTMLETQYRMHPTIMTFSSRMFYRSKLEAAKTILQRDHLFKSPFEFIDTAGGGYHEEVDKLSLSTFNLEEATFLVNHLKSLLAEYGNIILNKELKIGIIAPYKAQINTISQMIDMEDLATFKSLMSVNTVDAFQGQERDIIYISLVRSNERGEIGFLKEIRRLNVAMTRAKEKLVMIGDSGTLGQYDFFSQLLDYVNEVDGYRSVFEFDYTPQ